jgi:hypothetical protein
MRKLKTSLVSVVYLELRTRVEAIKDPKILTAQDEPNCIKAELSATDLF